MTKRIVKKMIEEQGMSFEETKAEAIASMKQNLAEIRATQKQIDDELADIERREKNDEWIEMVEDIGDAVVDLVEGTAGAFADLIDGLLGIKK